MTDQPNYIFVQMGDTCPEGTQKADIGTDDTYCRATCGAGTEGTKDCTGYPGVSLNLDNHQLKVNSSNPWILGQVYFHTTTSGCQLCSSGTCYEKDKWDECCSGEGGELTGCDLKGNSLAYYSGLKYKGANCDTPCNEGEERCAYRMKNGGCPTPTSKKYACVGNTCQEKEGGPYTDSNCNNQCGGPTPTPRAYKCIGNKCTYVGPGKGTYTDANCDRACKTAPGASISCIDGKCVDVGAGKGTYETISECSSDLASDCYKSNQKDKKGSPVVLILSSLAGVILVTIIGMVIFLFVSSKKKTTSFGK